MLLVLFALFPSVALAQYYDSPRYGVRYVDGQSYYYLLPSGQYFTYLGTQSYSPYQGNTLASGLSVSCTASPLTARIGEEVFWYSSVTGGAGNYAYSWSGADGLFGTQSAVRKAYSAAGEKYATITVTAGGQSVIAGCSQIVKIVPTVSAVPTIAAIPRLNASCYAAPERIASGESAAWFALVSGASPFATTTYNWAGTDELSGSAPAAFRIYEKNGLKHALLTVTSGGERVMTVCTNAITVGPKSTPQPATAARTVIAPAPLQGICSASVSEALVGDEVLWQASAVGGSGAFTFAWDGTDGLSGKNATSSKKYETEGRKTGSVKVASADKNITISCGDGVEIIPRKEDEQLAAAFLSGFANPATLTLLALLAILAGVCLATRKKRKENSARKATPAH